MRTNTMEHELREIVWSKKHATSDYTQSFMTMIYFTKCMNKEVFIWGVGKDTLGLIKILHNEDIYPQYITWIRETGFPNYARFGKILCQSEQLSRTGYQQ